MRLLSMPAFSFRIFAEPILRWPGYADVIVFVGIFVPLSIAVEIPVRV